MNKRTFALVIAVLLVAVLGFSAQSLYAEFPAGKAYDAIVWFTDYPVMFGLFDCLEFTSTKVCSLTTGQCAAYTMDYYDGVNGVASAPVFRYLGGKGDFTFIWERRGPRNTIAGAGQVKNFFPYRLNMTAQGFAAPYCAFLKDGDPDPAGRGEHPGKGLKGEPKLQSDNVRILDLE